MAESAKLTLDDKTIEFPVITGTENEKAFDIGNLRAQTLYITLDQGYGNTGACTSAITFLDGEKGILRYRGIPIEQIAEKSNFLETSYFLIYGKLPQAAQFDSFKKSLSAHYSLPPDMLKILNAYPSGGHPMGLLGALMCSLSGYYPHLAKYELSEEEFNQAVFILLAKMNTLCGVMLKKFQGAEAVEPRGDLDYISQFLHMIFSTPNKNWAVDKTAVDALDTLLILHADHEQNCSTSTVRLVGSSWTNIFASVASGVCALWGPLHGGANQKVLEMLEEIHLAGGDIRPFIAKAKDPNSNYRLMGFGHRVYKNFDPRAKIIKERCHDLFKKLGINDPLLEIAVKLEDAILKDEYFVQRKLYPNVDFYSGLIYKTLGIPTEMFTVMFAFGRMPGWIAHWKELKDTPKSKIGRPRQIYTGPVNQNYIPINQR